MIHDLRASGSRLLDDKYHVCVVGSGPAGLALALELARAGSRVCILEAGGDGYDATCQRWMAGRVERGSYPALRDVRFCGLGGTSAVWAGWCGQLDARDFNDWPLSVNELLPYYARASEFLGVPASSAALADPPTTHTDTFVERQIAVRPTRLAIELRQVLQSSTNITLVLHAPALHARIEGDRVAAVSVGAPESSALEVSADRYVFAAGGIENARLLLLSGSTPGQAPGNASDLVGRYFGDHPFAEIGTLVLGNPDAAERWMPRAGSASRTVLSLHPAVVVQGGYGNGGLFFKPAYESHPVFRSPEVRAFLELWEKLKGTAVPGNRLRYLRQAARGPHKVAVAMLRKAVIQETGARSRHVRAMFESEFRHADRVSLGDERDRFGRPKALLRWQPGARDLASMRHFVGCFGSYVRRLGLGRFEPAVVDDDAWSDLAECGKHHMGTTRMHPNPRLGVVDSNGRVHGTSNLYVTGSSVFPSGGWVNPTLTLVALALRLADHLNGPSSR